MKKILIATNLLMLSAVLFLSFDRKPAAPPPAGNDLYKDGGLAAKDESAGLISFNTAKMMSLNYVHDLAKSRVSNIHHRQVAGTGPVKWNNKDATAIWFSIEMLDNFVQQIKALPVKNYKLGVRIYYALYPDIKECKKNKDLADLNADAVANLHTAFLVPTYRDVLPGQHQTMDIDFDGVTVRDGKPVAFDTADHAKIKVPVILGFSPKKYANYSTVSTARDAIENHGGLSPPPGDGTFPTGANQ